MAGTFITFEGGEGTGKSSVMKAIATYIEESFNRTVLISREPGGVIISERIRDVILDVAHTEMTFEAEALLYAASRVQHLHEKIIPALDQGLVVLCDRYLDSSLAYQGYARGLGIEHVRNINSVAAKIMPDLTILIDLDPKTGLRRLHDNQRELDRLDQETIGFHERVREGYHILAQMEPKRFLVIDGSKPLTQVIEDIEQALCTFFAKQAKL